MYSEARGESFGVLCSIAGQVCSSPCTFVGMRTVSQQRGKCGKSTDKYIYLNFSSLYQRIDLLCGVLGFSWPNVRATSAWSETGRQE